MKFCNTCKKSKLLDFFYKRSDQTGYRSKCVDCVNIQNNNNYRKKHPWPIRLTLEQRKQGNLAALKRYRAKPESKAKHAQIQAKRRADKLKAMPSWLTQHQLDNIDWFYKWAKFLSEEDRKQWDVDHIVPLNGKNVCGLHVPWNMCVMEHKENMKKGNKNV